MVQRLRNYFGIETAISVEIWAGLTTFFAMAYIIVVNSQILSTTGMPTGALITATCWSAGLASILMGVWGKLPVGLAPGMGTNAYFAYFVCGTMGVPWPTALGAIFVSGIIFLALSVLGVRTKIIDAIPRSLRYGITAGIALFIGFIGLRNAEVVVDHPAVLVQIGDLSSESAMVFAGGLMVTAGLLIAQVRGAYLWGMAASTLMAIALGMVAMPSSWISLPPSISPIFLALDIPGALSLGLVHLLFTVVFVDLFDTLATLVAVTEYADKDSDNPQLPPLNRALEADAVGTILGALLGTSTVTSYIESSSGIAMGGRTGLTAVVVGVCFLLAPIFAPVVAVVPPAATAPVLILICISMFRTIRRINFDDTADFVPAMLVILTIPLTHSISDGLAFGCITYPILMLFAGKIKRVSPVMIGIGLLFLIKYVLVG